jgi:hypothetical protein
MTQNMSYPALPRSVVIDLKSELPTMPATFSRNKRGGCRRLARRIMCEKSEDPSWAKP